MRTLGVIGIGNLGMRHLESLCDLNNARLFGLETNHSRAVEMSRHFMGKVDIYESIADIPDEIDLVVIATNADVRKRVFIELTEKKSVRNIIFEKVLFQRISDYKEVEEILESKNICAWVNCVRREWKGYQKIKRELGETDSFSFSISEGEWGLGCNGIHILDLISFLAESDDMYISADGLETEIVDAKRHGFKEIYGMIDGRCGKCKSFHIECFRDSLLPGEIRINTNSSRYVIKEAEEKLYRFDQDHNWEKSELAFNVPFQSKLTSTVADEILRSKKCWLPTYHESSKIHIVFETKLLKLFEQNGIEEGLCPIT